MLAEGSRLRSLEDCIAAEESTVAGLAEARTDLCEDSSFQADILARRPVEEARSARMADCAAVDMAGCDGHSQP